MDEAADPSTADRSGPDIADYALLSDTRSAALVSRAGSIDWCCFPRFDAAACFAALLGTGDHGHWALHPTAAHRTERRYLPGTMVLETTFTTGTGSVTVTDALAPPGEHQRLLRLVTGISGSVELETRLVIRFDYGSILPWVRRLEDGRLSAVAGPEALALSTPVEVRGEGWTSMARFRVEEGRQVPFDLAWHPSNEDPPERIEVADVLDRTVDWWRTWSDRLDYDGPHRDEVRHSLVVLKALTHSPTGSVVAAATTSLPEWPGGTRNWDYRYCWLRDATLTFLALLHGGCTAEASAWRDWLLRAVAGDPGRVQIMYGIGGERRLPEWEVDWLPGFGGASPVRVGNAAATQRQLDVYGEVSEAMLYARRAGLDGDAYAWAVQRAMLDWLADHWDEPDDGIWEVRGERAHFTFSKVMAWVAFDRSVTMAEEFDLDGDLDRWRDLRDRIHADVCANAVDQKGRFTQAYGRDELDAACLMIPLVGFLPIDDPRVVATVDGIRTELDHHGLVRRYRTDAPSDGEDPSDREGDGVGGEEGAFLLCSFWLVDCLALLGRADEATALFDRLVSSANDLGLLAEELDPATGRLLGNYPQAFSHLALVSSALLLSEEHTGPSELRARRSP